MTFVIGLPFLPDTPRAGTLSDATRSLTETRRTRTIRPHVGGEMRVKKIQSVAESASIGEYVVGAAQREITYPGLVQCISITGYHVGRLLGTHISPGSTADEIVEHFRLLTTDCGDHYPAWYIAGQFKEHFATPKAVMSSMDKFRKTAREKLGKDSALYVFDSSTLKESEHWNWGIDIRATLVDGAPKFSFAKGSGAKKRFYNLAGFYFNRL